MSLGLVLEVELVSGFVVEAVPWAYVFVSGPLLLIRRGFTHALLTAS